MEINLREENNIIIVILEGELDISVIEPIREKFRKLTDEKKEALVVNLAGVPYIDSSGLGMFVETMQAMEKYGGKMGFAGLTPDVRKVFELTRLDKFFSIYDKEKEAAEDILK